MVNEINFSTRRCGNDKNGINTGSGITASIISDIVRSGIPPHKARYDSNKEIDDLYLNWSFSPIGRPHPDRYEKLLYLFYDLYKPRIRSIARAYKHLSPIFDEEDLQQTGLLGILQALIKYDHGEGIQMRFSTFLEWSVRNVFQRSIGYDDKFVEIYDDENNCTRVISYQEFIAHKKRIIQDSASYVIRSRECYISDISHPEALYGGSSFGSDEES
ncbi:MAG: sigma factor [Syntrophorhabdaceae bacterium]